MRVTLLQSFHVPSGRQIKFAHALPNNLKDDSAPFAASGFGEAKS